MNRLKAFFQRLPPEHQRRLVLAGSLLGVVGLILLMAAVVPEPRKLEPRKTRIKTLLTDADPRALGIDGLASELREIRKLQGDLTQRLKTLEEHRALPKDPSDHLKDEAIQSEITALKAEIEDLRKPTQNPSPAPSIPMNPPATTSRKSSKAPPSCSASVRCNTTSTN